MLPGSACLGIHWLLVLAPQEEQALPREPRLWVVGSVGPLEDGQGAFAEFLGLVAQIGRLAKHPT